ncbi:MAG: ribonuclease HI family protein [Epsilonproteobacteria bacterium]|nr:ribonuclease HI family protein [Campylobacterota bacterium]
MALTKKAPATPNRNTHSKRWTVYIDGAARGNPGPAGVGIYALNDDQQAFLKLHAYLGHKTNNQAEYLALVYALFSLTNQLKKLKSQKIFLSIFSDSELLVKQMSNLYKVKNPCLAQLKLIAQEMLSDIEHEFCHVTRDKNTHADALANQGVDERQKLPTTFLAFLADHNLII